MGISDTSCMIDGLPLLYWRWNLGKSGQGSTLRFTKSHTSLDNIVSLGNRIAYDFRRDLRTA